MIFQDNHVAPMQVPYPRAAGIVSTARTTPSTISRSTVFSTSSDLKTATDTPDSQHTDNSKQTNSTNLEDRPPTRSAQNIKGGRSRTSPQQQYTGGSVVCFLKDNGVTANPDMNSFRKFRRRRRIFILTVMTIGFFTTMVYSLLFSCCTVINVDRSALPTRWESGVGAMISDTPDSTSVSDISLPESDRSSSTLQLSNNENGRPMSQNLGIGSSEMLVVSGQFAGQSSKVLDREYYGKKIGSRTILLAPSSDTFLLPESSLSQFLESPRSITFDISSQRSQAHIYQQKEAAQRKRAILGRAQHRHHHALQRQITQQDQTHKQQIKWKREQKSQQIIESLKSRHGQRSTIFHLWHRNINDMKLPKSDLSSDSLQGRQPSKRTRINNSAIRNTNDTVKNVEFAVASEEDYFEEEAPIRLFSSDRNTHPERINIQIEKNDRNDKNNFIDFKKILSKSKSKESVISSEKLYSKSNIDFEIMQQVLSQSERTSTKTPVAFNQRKETINQWKHLTLPTKSGNVKPDIFSRKEFNMYYVTGTRDIGTMNDIGTSRRADSQDAVDSNVPVSDENLGREVDDENSVIYAGNQEDYYYFPDDSQTIGRSETKSGVSILKAPTKGQSVAIEDSILTEQILFVNSKVKNNDSYFEYRDDEDGDDVDYYEEKDANYGVDGVERDSDVSNKDGDLSKSRHNSERTRTSLAHLLSLTPSFSSSFSRTSSFSSQPNQLSAAFRREEQASLSSLSPVVAGGPTSSSSARHRVKTRAKQPSILQQHHQPRREIQASLKNHSAPLSSSSSSVSIASVLASALVTADKSHVGAPFGGAGHSRYVPHHGRTGPSGVRVQQMATKKLPQAIIIGVKKGGTRAVLEFLRLHPNVRAPGPEPHFFDRHYQKGFDWYRNKMPATLDDQITIEKTPSYFVTKEVPRRIFNMSKDIKLIVVVRDPVTRAISDYTQTVSKRSQVRSFEQMVFINNTRIVDTSWGAIRIGVYAKHVSLWLKFFNLSQIHFVNGERLIRDPAGEMAQLQDFLGLKRIINERHFFFNEIKGFPCLKKPEGSGHPHCLGKTKGRTHPIISQKVLKRLRDFYRPFNSKFYQLVHKDFQWS